MLDAELYGKAAGILNLAAFIPYILAIFGLGLHWNIWILGPVDPPTKPNRATWFIWTFVAAVILPAYSVAGAQETIWVPVALTTGPCIVALLSIKWGEGGWTPFDQICLAGTCFSVLMWIISGSPVVGLFFALAADAFGTAATIRHAYRHPEEESRLAWSLFLAGDSLNLLAVTDWSWSAYAVWILPVYMVAHIVPITLLVYRKQAKREENPQCN